MRSVALPGIAAEVREVLLNPDTLERTADLALLLNGLGPESITPVRAAYDSVFMDLGEIDLILLAEWWARHDPEDAFAWTRSEWQADHPVVVFQVLRAWGRSDHEAALRAVQEFPQPALRRPYVDAVLSGWDESGDPGLLEWIEGLGAGHDRQRALYTVARRKVLHEGIEAAFRWAEDLPDDDEVYKLNAYRRVASSAAEVDPEAAAAWAERHADGEYGLQLPRRVGTRWAKRDPEAAMRWLSTLPPSWNRDDAVRETYRNWLRLDGDRATQWMREAPLEPWLEPAVALFAKKLSREDPETGLEWAGRISGEELRWGTVSVIARAWLLVDEEAAKGWIDGSAMPDLYRRKVFAIPEGIRRQLPGDGGEGPAD
jgi:hypothetical protein